MRTSADQQSPAWPNDFWVPIKFIPLDILPGSYINFGGELRERVEHFSRPFFGLTPRASTTYDLHRLLLNGDLHIGDSFRTFIQFGNHLVSSKSLSPPTDVDRFDLQQGFADLKAPLGQNVSMTFRGGRQEILLGSERLVGVREGPNIRMSFDGGRVFYESPDLRLDAFGVVPVVPERGVFDDRGDARQAFPGKVLWGVYGVMPVKAVPGLHLDLYYLGLARKNAPFNSVVASHGRDGAVTVHQDVELLVAVLDPEQQRSHRLKPGRHGWLQLARGGASLNGTTLHVGDGAAISMEEVVEIKSLDHAEILLFDLA